MIFMILQNLTICKDQRVIIVGLYKVISPVAQIAGVKTESGSELEFDKRKEINEIGLEVYDTKVKCPS